jgi:hypothetical protein
MTNKGVGRRAGSTVRGVIRTLVVAATCMLAVAIAAPAAGAASIIGPADDPVVVTVDDAGYPAPFTVQVRGYEPFQSVYIVQCNGRTPEDDDWRPAVDCDVGSAPAAAIADESGVATFAADDPNHAFRPFVGPSPQRSFNCLGPDAPSPKNELEDDYRNCQVRVSSNNTRPTDDQVFLRMQLPNKAREWSPEIVPGVVTPNASTDGPAGETAADPAGSGQAAASGELAASRSEAGESKSDEVPATSIGVLVLVAVALGVGTFYLVRRRRTRQVAA